MAKKKKRRRTKKHECNGALCFHGAFTDKGRAEAKERKLGKKAFIVRKLARWGGGSLSSRWVVATRDTAADFNF
jgi:hypothetical protein